MSSNALELLVFVNESSGGASYTLGFLSPTRIVSGGKPPENFLEIFAQGAIHSIQVQPGGNIPPLEIPPIKVNPQTFEIHFEKKNLEQPLPPIIIKGTGRDSDRTTASSHQALCADEFLTRIEFNEEDSPITPVEQPELPFTTEYLIESHFQIYTECKIFPEGKRYGKPVPIPLAAGFIITCLK
jgi:hypothetical protein